MQKRLLIVLGWVLFYQPFAIAAEHFQRALSTEEKQQQIRDFIDNVFPYYDSSKFLQLLKQIRDKSADHSDNFYYEKLVKHIGEISLSGPQLILKKKEALRLQQEEITKETMDLLAPLGFKRKNNNKRQHDLSGYLEIGTLGRYVGYLRDEMHIHAPILVMNDVKPGFINPIHVAERTGSSAKRNFKSLFWRNDFVDLNDYKPIDPNKVRPHSLDLITQYIGLHHIPESKLQGFIRSIYTSLRPGGVFVLRDHNYTTDVTDIVHLAHIIFNMGTGVSADDNKKEVRNFQPLNYWIELLERVGFEKVGGEILQKGDPTANTLIAFRKPSNGINDIQALPDNSSTDMIKTVMINSHKDYKRDASHGILSVPEWFVVHIFEDFAKYLSHTPWYAFPYKEYQATYWKIFQDAKTHALEESTDEKELASYESMCSSMGQALDYFFRQARAFASMLKRFSDPNEFDVPTNIYIIVESGITDWKSIDDKIIQVKGFTNETQVLELPRYAEFAEILIKISDAGATVIEVAGHDQITILVNAPKTRTVPCDQGTCKIITQYDLPVYQDRREAAVRIKLSELGEFRTKVQNLGGYFKHIYDY